MCERLQPFVLFLEVLEILSFFTKNGGDVFNRVRVLEAMCDRTVGRIDARVLLPARALSVLFALCRERLP